MTQPPDPTELETAMAAVYRGPLEEFVSRRDALSKELRAAKRREDADRVKALRKPSRTAWVLDNVVSEDPACIEHLAEAINAAQTVQSGADLRAALESVRAAVREVAAAGTRFAIRAGQPVDANALATAVHAVIGDTSAYTDMRAGRLVDVPEGGGLDILTGITIIPPPPPRAPSSPSIAPAAPAPPKTEAPAPPSTEDAELAIAARADLRRAETSLAAAREQADRAEQAVRSAQGALDAAERALLHAQAEAQAHRANVARAQRDAEAAAGHLRHAEQTVAAARARILDSSHH